MDKETMKTKIGNADTMKEIDDILSIEFKTTIDKVNFLSSIYEIKIFGRDNNTVEEEYECILDAIVSLRKRNISAEKAKGGH